MCTATRANHDRRSPRKSRQARIAAAAVDVADRERRRRETAVFAVGAVVLVVILAAMLLTSRPQSTDAARLAPGFSLTDTNGQQVSLEQYRGRNIVLYFNEGVGCQFCLVQMAEIEKRAPRFQKLDITVLPIVMNGRDEITATCGSTG